MPSYTEGQKRKAVETVDGCGGSVTLAIRRLGYPSRQKLYKWLNQHDTSHERRAGRPWSRYDPVLRAQAVAFVRSGMTGRDVAEMLGVSSAAVACNWARDAENPSRAAADRSPIVPMRDSENRSFDGFEGDLEERVRRLELENDILRAAAKVLKAASPGAMTWRSHTPGRRSGAARTRARCRTRRRTCSTGTSAPAPRTSSGSRTSPSSGCRAARSSSRRSSTASTAPRRPGR